MKTKRFPAVLFFLLLIGAGCKVADISSCEYVVNSNGPSFLKVKNNIKQEVIIENQKTNQSKTLHFTVTTGETYTVTVDDNFFNH